MRSVSRTTGFCTRSCSIVTCWVTCAGTLGQLMSTADSARDTSVNSVRTSVRCAFSFCRSWSLTCHNDSSSVPEAPRPSVVPMALFLAARRQAGSGCGVLSGLARPGWRSLAGCSTASLLRCSQPGRRSSQAGCSAAPASSPRRW